MKMNEMNNIFVRFFTGV